MGLELNAGHSGRALLAAKAEGRAALVGYLPVGYPDVPGSLAAMRALAIAIAIEAATAV